jgi:hypothetical protein
MAASILQAVQNYRRAVGTQMGDTVARNVPGPRVETNAPMLRGGPPTWNEGQPTVITPTASNSGAN